MLKNLAALAAALVAAPALAQAAPAVALTDDNRLVPFDTGSMQTTGSPVRVRGVEGTLLGIDVRPSNGMLYGVSDSSKIYTIDPKSGSASMVAALSEPFPSGGRAIVDFNPVADRLRLMGATGTNFRVHPDTGAVTTDGTVKYDPAGPHAAMRPVLMAGAYTNSMAGAKETALYTIDGGMGALNLQAPPNDGVQKPQGMLGAMTGNFPGFDIDPMGGANQAWLLDGGALHTVDLKSGAATKKGPVKGLRGYVIDLAVMPGG